MKKSELQNSDTALSNVIDERVNLSSDNENDSLPCKKMNLTCSQNLPMEYVEDDISNKEKVVIKDADKDKPIAKKYNFSKRRTKFESRNRRKLQTTPGKEQHRTIDRKSKRTFRSTSEGIERQREIDQKAKERFRSTPEGIEKQRKINRETNEKFRSTEEGKMKNQQKLV